MRPLKRNNLPVDMPKLGVPIWMAAALLSLAVALQGIPCVAQNIDHGARTDVMAQSPQFDGQLADALGSPQQGIFGIAGYGWFDQTINVAQKGRIRLDNLLAPSAGPANPTKGQRLTGLDFLRPAPNGQFGDSSRLGYQPNPAPTNIHCFGGTPEPPTPFGQRGGQSLVLHSNPFEVHASIYRLYDDFTTVIFARRHIPVGKRCGGCLARSPGRRVRRQPLDATGGDTREGPSSRYAGHLLRGAN